MLLCFKGNKQVVEFEVMKEGVAITVTEKNLHYFYPIYQKFFMKDETIISLTRKQYNCKSKQRF